ncbi:hypothetical protein J4463_00685 [Candidatus Pacearchaeota archaeon]|nr:hypothetical protein [Candidatus Pacearchaeota archaeon]
MKEVKHVISVLKNAEKAAIREDIVALKKLSDMTIHSSVISQDEDNVMVAVIIYVLSKVIERGEKYYKGDYKKYVSVYVNFIKQAVYALEKNDEIKFRESIKEMFSSKELDPELRGHISDIFRKAKINKASKIYEHGISMGKTAEILGISIWELAEYSGQTGIADSPYSKTMDIKKRVNNAVEMFK